MKRLTALLLTLLLCLGASFAMADWYTDTALALAPRLGMLCGNQTFVELFVDKQEGVEEELEMMSALTGLEPVSSTVYLYRPEKLSGIISAYFMEDRVDADSEALAQELLSRMNPNLPLLLNNLSGGDLWSKLSAVLSVTESYASPADFQSCAVFLDYGLDTGILVIFSGNTDAVTAYACYIRSEVFTGDIAREWLNLLWEKE